MEKHCTSVYFLVKKSRQDKEGLSPIVAFISVNAECVSYYTGKKTKVSDWDSEKQIVKGKGEVAKQINEYLYHLRHKNLSKRDRVDGKSFFHHARIDCKGMLVIAKRVSLSSSWR